MMTKGATNMTHEQRWKVFQALNETRTYLERYEARRIYTNPQGIVETGYNMETEQQRASYRRHMCVLEHSLRIDVMPNMTTHLRLF
jgi:hypothetical protein